VDVGGGYGTQAIAFQKKYPNLPGRVIIEDLPETVKQLAQQPGVEALAQDFFQPQSVKGILLPHPLPFPLYLHTILGAKFYYMRNITHDWLNSFIVIDEMALPNSGVRWQMAQLDMLMMAVLAARECTHEQVEQTSGKRRTEDQ
jgi:demethylsterigmatocystin 6-O-methyltransferase